MLELLIFLFYLFLCYLFSLCFVFVFFFFVLSLAGALNRGGGFFLSHLVLFIGRSGSGFFFANLRFSVVFFLSFLYLPSR